MSDESRGTGWWLASDGKWYPPESRQYVFAPPSPPVPGREPGNGRSPAWLMPSHVSGWAVAAGYLGLFTLICVGVPGPFALVAGIKGLRQIRRQPDLNGRVRAWVGIVFGVLGCCLLGFIALAYALDGRA
jgi:hypothetical protein